MYDMIISPPIFVESRRKTHPEKVANSTENLNRFNLYEPFLPKLLDIIFEKGVKCKESSEPIGEDIQGLLDYLSCPTIRHKIFHPLFLLIKFN